MGYDRRADRGSVVMDEPFCEGSDFKTCVSGEHPVWWCQACDCDHCK